MPTLTITLQVDDTGLGVAIVEMLDVLGNAESLDDEEKMEAVKAEQEAFRRRLQAAYNAVGPFSTEWLENTDLFTFLNRLSLYARDKWDVEGVASLLEHLRNTLVHSTDSALMEEHNRRRIPDYAKRIDYIRKVLDKDAQNNSDD